MRVKSHQLKREKNDQFAIYKFVIITIIYCIDKLYIKKKIIGRCHPLIIQLKDQSKIMNVNVQKTRATEGSLGLIRFRVLRLL